MPKKEVNLLPQEEFEKKPVGKFLLWALNIGRWIVIATELIVIIAFLSRFKLDRDLADLYEEIRAKQAIITSLNKFEGEFRFTQDRLSWINQLQKDQPTISIILSAISQSVPTDVVLDKLALEKDDVALSGLALSENGLKTFLNALAHSPVLGDINLSNVSKKQEEEGGIQFSLTGKVKKQGGNNGP